MKPQVMQSFIHCLPFCFLGYTKCCPLRETWRPSSQRAHPTSGLSGSWTPVDHIHSAPSFVHFPPWDSKMLQLVLCVVNLCTVFSSSDIFLFNCLLHIYLCLFTVCDSEILKWKQKCSFSNRIHNGAWVIFSECYLNWHLLFLTHTLDTVYIYCINLLSNFVFFYPIHPLHGA